MSIVSIKFLLFLLLTVTFYWFIGDKYKNLFLIIMSMFYCTSFGIVKALETLIYVIFTFFLSKDIIKNKVFSIALCVTPLIYSKYFIEIIPLKSLPNISIIGISYLTFKAISYLIESRKKELQLSFKEYVLYMVFYPILLSGPIENPIDFKTQIHKKKDFDENSILVGLLIVSAGYFMKLVIADRLKIYIDFFYSGTEKYGLLTWFSIFMYSIYIYCDFCGYSYIALGMAKTFGFEVTTNFKQPYLSTNCRDFWNNWHISLNNWLRKYIYIPLGGSRKGKLRKYLNIIFTFLVSGIWHGAGLGFIVWGLLNGIYQIVEDMFFSKKKKSKLSSILGCIKTYILITISWIFFDRGFIKGLKTIFNSLRMPSISLDQLREEMAIAGFTMQGLIPLAITFVIIATLLAIEIDIKQENRLVKRILKSTLFAKYSLLFMAIVIIVIFGYFSTYNAANFIYFNF